MDRKRQEEEEEAKQKKRHETGIQAHVVVRWHA